MQFTRIPKTSQLISAGASPESIATYCALSDYANNKNGLCWPKMETLAAEIGRSVRTVQRHLHELREAGLVEFVMRRRSNRGRFSSWLFRVLGVPGMASSKKSTTGHGRRVGKAPPIFPGTKRGVTAPKSPSEKDYSWLFGGGDDAEWIRKHWDAVMQVAGKGRTSHNPPSRKSKKRRGGPAPAPATLF